MKLELFCVAVIIAAAVIIFMAAPRVAPDPFPGEGFRCVRWDMESPVARCLAGFKTFKIPIDNERPK